MGLRVIGIWELEKNLFELEWIGDGGGGGGEIEIYYFILCR